MQIETVARLITAKAINQLGILLDTVRAMETAELDTITGWDATADLENIRSVLDHLIEANEILVNCL